MVASINVFVNWYEKMSVAVVVVKSDDSNATRRSERVEIQSHVKHWLGNARGQQGYERSNAFIL